MFQPLTTNLWCNPGGIGPTMFIKIESAKKEAEGSHGTGNVHHTMEISVKLFIEQCIE